MDCMIQGEYLPSLKIPNHISNSICQKISWWSIRFMNIMKSGDLIQILGFSDFAGRRRQLLILSKAPRGFINYLSLWWLMSHPKLKSEISKFYNKNYIQHLFHKSIKNYIQKYISAVFTVYINSAHCWHVAIISIYLEQLRFWSWSGSPLAPGTL